jgi:FPC/CPF motif-containing protein YcgG
MYPTVALVEFLEIENDREVRCSFILVELSPEALKLSHISEAYQERKIIIHCCV